VYFAEAFAGRNPGFDIAIGNPPYFSIDPKLKRISRQDYRYLKNNYKSFNGLTDIMVFFYEKSLDLLKNNGILAFISKNRWYNSASYKSFQNYLVYKNIFILDFDDTFIFGGVGVTTNIILIMKNKKPEVNYQLFDNSGLSNIFNFSHYKKYHFVPIPNTTWNLMVDSIVKKMMKSGSYILYGGSGHKITPGDYFKLIKIGDSLVPEKTSLRNKVGELNFNKQEKTYIFPFASSGDIFPYCLVRKNRFIFNLYGADLNQLPNIRKYFMTLKKERSKNRWYEYHNGQGYRNIDIISKQRKIVFPKRMYINRKSSFYLDEDSIVIGMDCGALISKNLNLDLRYILSILNSGLMWYYIRKTFKRYANRQTLEIEKLPIIEIPIDKQQPFIEIVDKILSITQLDDYLQNSAKQAQVKEYERQIDQMVYELYELTKEEIKIVENFRQ